MSESSTWHLLYSQEAASQKPLFPNRQYHCVIHYRGKFYVFTELSKNGKSETCPDAIDIGRIDLSEGTFIEDFGGPKTWSQIEIGLRMTLVPDAEIKRMKKTCVQRHWLFHGETNCKDASTDGPRKEYAIYDALQGKIFFPTNVKKSDDNSELSSDHFKRQNLEYLGTIYLDCTTACFVGRTGNITVEDVRQKLRWLNRTKDEITKATKIYENVLDKVPSDKLGKVVFIDRPPLIPQMEQKLPVRTLG